ncbi:proteophosphoglycan 5 [Moniliophthora roreri]|nr:proteophosphoglycan 5 [Moniliophthora roreri]
MVIACQLLQCTLTYQLQHTLITPKVGVGHITKQEQGAFSCYTEDDRLRVGEKEKNVFVGLTLSGLENGIPPSSLVIVAVETALMHLCSK